MREENQILIVEDEPAMAQLIEEGLGSAFHCVHATSVVDGQKRLASQDFDLVVADLHLPDSTGITLLQKLRQTGKDTPFIVITGMPSVDTTLLAMRLKVAGYVAKPFDLNEFRDLVASSIVQSRQTRALLNDPAVKQSVARAHTHHQLVTQFEVQSKMLQGLVKGLSDAQSKVTQPEVNADSMNAAATDFLRKAVVDLASFLGAVEKMSDILSLLQSSEDRHWYRGTAARFGKARQALVPTAPQSSTPAASSAIVSQKSPPPPIPSREEDLKDTGPAELL